MRVAPDISVLFAFLGLFCNLTGCKKSRGIVLTYITTLKSQKDI